jgi:hypothetical protein
MRSSPHSPALQLAGDRRFPVVERLGRKREGGIWHDVGMGTSFSTTWRRSLGLRNPGLAASAKVETKIFYSFDRLVSRPRLFDVRAVRDDNSCSSAGTLPSETPIIVPQTGESCPALAGNDPGLVIRTGAPQRQQTKPSTGALWLSPTGVADNQIAIKAPIPRTLHLHPPASLFHRPAHDFNLPSAGPLHRLRRWRA